MEEVNAASYFGEEATGFSNENDICQADNVELFIERVNLKLDSLGITFSSSEEAFGSQKKLNFQGMDPENTVVVLNTFLTLLSYHERDDARIKELEEKNAKLVKQLDFTENNLGLTQRELDGSQRESHQLRLRLETSQAELKKTTQQLTTTKEDLKKTTSRAQSSKTQFLHDLKKKETEIEKLKNTIQKTSTDRSSQVKFGMEVVNPVTKSMSSDVNPTKDVHNLLVEAHHRRERELKNEVDELRKVLFDAHLLLAEQLQNLNDTDAPTPVGEYTQRVETFRVSSDIPFDILRGALGESVSEALIYLKEQGLDSRSKLEELESMMQDQFEQIFELERQLGESKEIIEQQERLLERKLEMDINPSEPLMLPLDEIDQSLKALESERKAFNEQKKIFEEERKAFKQKQFDQGREKIELEKQKKLLEIELSELETKRMLASLPSTPDWIRKAMAKGCTDLENVDPLSFMSPFTPKTVKPLRGSSNLNSSFNAGSSFTSLSSASPMPSPLKTGNSLKFQQLTAQKAANPVNKENMGDPISA